MILHLASDAYDPSLISEAASTVAGGGTVIFPTETVYGIGADLRCTAAILQVCRLKQRSVGQPQLVHCSSERQLAGLVQDIPDAARKLIAAFWPGPLALIFKAVPGLPSTVIGPGNTVGIRMLAHPVTCALIEELGSPLAGTSANLHGRPATSDFTRLSPELLEGVDIALDSGVCGTDVASTVLDVSSDVPRLLRKGVVSLRAIEAVLDRPIAQT